MADTPRDADARYRATFHQSPASTVVYDHLGHPIRVNPAFEQLWGTRLEDVPPGYSVLADPQLAAAGVIPELQKAFSGTAVTLPALPYDIASVTGAGRTLWTQATVYPVFDGQGRVVEVVLSHRDVTRERLAHDRANRLLAVARGLGDALTPEDVADVIFREGLSALDADAGSLSLLHYDDNGEPTEFEIVRDTGYTAGTVALYRRFPLVAGRPLTTTALTRSSVLVESFEQWTERFPATVDAIRATGYEAFAAVPLIGEGQVLAGLSLSFRGPHFFDDGVRVFLESLAALGGQALVRGRLYANERAARERSESILRDARLLSDAGQLLASSLDYQATIGSLVRACVPAIADWCAVDLVRDPDPAAWPPQLERVAIYHQDPEQLRIAAEFQEKFPTDWERDSAMSKALRHGEATYVPVITDEMLAASALDEEHLGFLRRLHFRSAIIIPLEARGARLGVLTLCMTDSERHFDDRHLSIARELAYRAAVAVDNSRLYEGERRARADAQAANLAKTAFLANMSHELRTPLNAIGGYAELLETGVRGPISAPQRADIERIRHNQRHLLSLINDILNFARIETGRIDLQLEALDVDQAISQLEGLIAPQLRAKGITYRLRQLSPGARVVADEDRMRQVLLNLLSNAVKFTGTGGIIEVTSVRVDDRVEITVADSGIGISVENMDRIFDPFVQVERRLANPVEGTGLGLAISRDLARAMNGELSVMSEVGGGSEFRLTLPAAP
ncbi:MAG: ATP-binding region ATPase domain protein [Gemmatimonadetes bacterium]|nr:ATP-binding region ATPase domain protein [Gemmatimonadota bacterium]